MGYDLSRLRLDAKAIFSHCLSSIDPKRLVKQVIIPNKNGLVVNGSYYDYSKYNRIFVIGAGKAGASMGKAVEDILGDRIDEGMVVVKYGYGEPCRKIKIIEAGHPIPDEAGVGAAQSILEIVRNAGGDDLIICLISGGGSALLTLPAEGISLEDKQNITSLLLKCGADIREMNAVRKHLSQIKGGLLAKAAYPAEMLVFILSDVIGDPLDVIASGPTVPDNSTFDNCLDVLNKYKLKGDIPKNVLALFKMGAEGIIPETPKADDSAFEKVRNMIIGNNEIAVKSAQGKAEELGYNVYTLPKPIQGDTQAAAKTHCDMAKSVLNNSKPISPPSCIISGGETTVIVKGNGLGGRNMEFALVSAIEIAGFDNIVVLSGGTDGTDGPTDAAGAIADNKTIERAEQSGIKAEDYLDNNDSYSFFKMLDDLIITGPTKTNVMDIHILMIDK